MFHVIVTPPLEVRVSRELAVVASAERALVRHDDAADLLRRESAVRGGHAAADADARVAAAGSVSGARAAAASRRCRSRRGRVLPVRRCPSRSRRRVPRPSPCPSFRIRR